MHSTATIHEIDRLLKEGKLSQRKIATLLNVSRGTVNSIASGRRGLFGKDPDNDHLANSHESTPTRCPSCGYRVYLPCLICETRKLKYNHTE